MDYEIPNEPPPWAKWAANTVHPIEFDGVHFMATYAYNMLHCGAELTIRAGFDIQGTTLTLYTAQNTFLNCNNSCAYTRIYPTGGSPEILAIFSWWLKHIELPRGSLAYLTRNDGPVEKLKLVMRKRGFKVVCVNKSKHNGHYPVYLLVHPGDDLLKQKRTTKVDLNDDILAVADGNSNATKLAGNPVASARPAPFIPDAYALTA